MIKYGFWMGLLLVLLAAALPIGRATGGRAAAATGAAVEPALAAQLDAGGTADFFVVLREQANLNSARTVRDKTAKGELVWRTLSATAERSQTALLAELQQRGVVHRPFWIVNAIWVHGDAETLNWLAAQPEVERIHRDDVVRLEATTPERSPLFPAAVPWGIAKVEANLVWSSLGVTGAGAVVAGQDTGYQWNHPALRDKYRGWRGGTADHNYNWHDAIHVTTQPGTNPCGVNSPVPCDDNGHGTHTMGTMIGDDGGTNQIGMAPGASWISCRNMDRGDGRLSTYVECFEWFIAPTDLAGANPNPAMAPHVINNSWGCPASEGCNSTNFAVMQAAVDASRAAGIVVVVSAGNSGSACSTVNTPAAIHDSSFTVGNTTSNDGLANSSSRGPVTVDGSNRRKPDISAPGTSVYSSYPTNTYATLSGTSMAGPHVAGLVALMIEANPWLAGDVDAIETIIQNTAVPVNVTQTCGGIPSSTIPNNSFGYGRINALAAVQEAINQIPPTSVGLQNAAAQTTSPAWPLWLAAAALASMLALLWQQRAAAARRGAARSA